MTSASVAYSILGRCALWTILVCGSTAGLGAQMPSSRDVDSVVARAASALEKELSPLSGRKYVRASEFCNAGPVQFVCDLDRPVSNAKKRVLDSLFARAFGPSVPSAPSQETLLSARADARRQADADALRKVPTNTSKPPVVVSRESARAAYESKCGAPERWFIIAELLQVSARTDSVLVNMSVTQMGPLAGCGGGAQMWRIIAIRRQEGFVLGPLIRGGHWELAFEIPKRTP